ncbi:MAG: aldehyde dehydrogenase family protein, partial [Planctomycetota bacterium]|nr:aldehyde dehydrogenase family protein [Planctomycetota bacterium]
MDGTESQGVEPAGAPPSLSFGASWTYDPAPESAAVAPIAQRYELYIDGTFCSPRAGRYFDTVEPGTGEVLSEVAHGDAGDVDRAIAAARRAQPGWA